MDEIENVGRIFLFRFAFRPKESREQSLITYFHISINGLVTCRTETGELNYSVTAKYSILYARAWYATS